MNIEDLNDYCQAKKGVEATLPFDANTMVYKVMGKMFALTNLNDFKSVNLKCDPLYALELRASYQDVTPGYHMSKKHWNTVLVNEQLADDFIYQLIDDSYGLVVRGLTKKMQSALEALPD